MTSITLTDEQLDHFADALADRIAVRLVDRLAAPAESSAPRLVDAAELARILSVSRSMVYQHGDELGARPVGGGEKPRLRFDPQLALEAWSARSDSRRSGASSVNGDGARATSPAPSRRRLPNGLAETRLPTGPAPSGRRHSSRTVQREEPS